MASVRDALDQMLGGNLDERLRAWRAAGLSYREVAERVGEETGVHVSYMSIVRWMESADDTGAAS